MLKFMKNVLKQERVLCEKHYSPIDVSATLIDYAMKHNYTITNLQLQKLLYFTQIEYLKEAKTILFNEEFQAWTYGPVQYDVWKCYKLYNRKSITKIVKGEVIEDEVLENILNSKIEMYFQESVWDLIKQSQSEHPWKNAIELEQKNISNKSIVKFALSN